jgi:hypothetical protein
MNLEQLEYMCHQTRICRHPNIVMTCEVNITTPENSKVIMDHFKKRFSDIEHAHIACGDSKYYKTVLEKLIDYKDFNYLKMNVEKFTLHFPFSYPFLFVLFNKEDDLEKLIEQVVWFAHRSEPGSRFVFNNWDKNNLINDILKIYNFKPVDETETTICYERFKKQA